MIIRDVINYLEELAPLSYAEDFDNVGVLVGDAEMPLTNVLVTLDTLESTVEEAIAANCNLIVSFHPILFKGLKRITGQNYVEKAVIKAIKNDIVIYAMHTALDNMKLGVSGKMAEMLGLSNIQVLVPKSKVIKKLLTYVPHDYAEKVRQALFNAGAGQIGNYDNCSFSSGGIGTYIPNEKAKPTIGAIGKLQEESETAMTVTFEKQLEKAVLRALFKEHPYEEVAFEMSTLDNIHQN
ncbi:MAG TPA: Nif3-like dinuclear metal center hexameric protein, partial [Saprospiraceae bacterium]|nr:Nif3-like dinuclear metal center hexameric protein [Saprospiraceae bacterium]